MISHVLLHRKVMMCYTHASRCLRKVRLEWRILGLPMAGPELNGLAMAWLDSLALLDHAQYMYVVPASIDKE